jgi:glutathione peroxidase
MKTVALIFTLMFFSTSSVYEFKLTSIDGQSFSLAQFKGKKVLIVNTASKCGFTPQYAELQKLADQYKGKLVVVGFPANNFANQEPAENLEIKSLGQKNFAVTVPLSSKLV